MNSQSKSDEKRKDTYVRKLQITITVLAIAIAITHLVLPTVTIDYVTLILLILAVLPWVAPLFKSLEFPGGWKVEFHELKEAEEKADRAGLLSAKPVRNEPEYSFQIVASQDPNLALAGLRIEIEKRLNQLAEVNGIAVGKVGLGQLLRVLSDKGILTSNESSVLAEISGILTSAVHGASVDKATADFAIDLGSRLLKTFDEKIQKSKVQK